MVANDGRLKGKRIELGQSDLSQILKRIRGKPDVYKDEQAVKNGIGKRSGVASFFCIDGKPNSGGHIELVHRSANGLSKRARTCFFGAMEIWFWLLK